MCLVFVITLAIDLLPCLKRIVSSTIPSSLGQMIRNLNRLKKTPQYHLNRRWVLVLVLPTGELPVPDLGSSMYLKQYFLLECRQCHPRL